MLWLFERPLVVAERKAEGIDLLMLLCFGRLPSFGFVEFASYLLFPL